MAKNALEYVAKREDVSIDSIRYEIDSAVAEARKTQDPKAQIFWEAISREGNHLTAEEVIEHIASAVKNKFTENNPPN